MDWSMSDWVQSAGMLHRIAVVIEYKLERTIGR